MVIIGLIRKLLSLYALLLLIDFALPFITDEQRPWMNVVHRLSDPGIRAGNRVADRLFPTRRSSLNMGAISAVALCLIARVILSFFQ